MAQALKLAWHVSILDPGDARRRKLLNILLVSVWTAVLLSLVVLLLATLIGTVSLEDSSWFFPGALSLLVAVPILFAINRSGSGTLASTLFLLLFTVVLTFTDDPHEVIQGRTLFMLTIPILMASVLLRPWASFVMTGLISLLLASVALNAGFGPEEMGALPFTAAALLIVALVSWLTTHELERALDSLHNANLALSESEERLRTVIADAPVILWAVDRQGVVTFAQGQGLTSRGVASEALVGRRAAELYPGLPWIQESIDRALAGQDVIASGGADGSWFDLRVSPVRDKAGQVTGAIGIATDTSERKRVEEALKESEAQARHYATELEHSNQELQHFAYVASHDLQEPLRMVTGYLRLLERHLDDRLDAQAREFMGYALDGASRMQVMIRGILDLSRVSTRGRAFEPVDTEALFSQALRTLGLAIADSGAVITHDPLPTVSADAVQLGQVFQNLMANAIKFCRPEEPPRVHISAKQENGEWCFAFRDRGIGLDPAQAGRLFQLFQRLHAQEEYPGLGLGLVLCRRIVERHGGRIWVESEPGKGATFYFTIKV